MKKLIIALTGGIASGKTTVANLFKELGAHIVDADKIAHDITKTNTPAYQKIIDHFGVTVINPDQSINRQQLRKIVFANPEEKNWLEDLLHPIIREQMLVESQESDAPYTIFVIPLLFETNNNPNIDRILVVDCDEAMQIKRAMHRDQNNEQQIKHIMAAQVKREHRLQQADDVIENNSDLTALKNAVEKLQQKYLELAKNKA